MGDSDLMDERMAVFLKRLEYVKEKSMVLSRLWAENKVDEAESLVGEILKSLYELKAELPADFWSDAETIGIPAEDMYYSSVISLRNSLGMGHMRRGEYDNAIGVFNGNLEESGKMTSDLKFSAQDNLYILLCNAYMLKGDLAGSKAMLAHLRDQSEAKKLEGLIAKLEGKPPGNGP